MAIVLLPLALTVVVLVAAGRAAARVAEEADRLRIALARVNAQRPALAEVGLSARRLRAGIAHLGG